MILQGSDRFSRDELLASPREFADSSRDRDSPSIIREYEHIQAIKRESSGFQSHDDCEHTLMQ